MTTKQLTTKHELIDKIEREAEQWEELLHEVGQERMEQPGAMGAWTFKDLVAHISAWRSGVLNRLEAARHDQAPITQFWPAMWDEEEDVEKINHWIYEENHERTLRDVLNESRLQFRHIRELVRALSERDLFDATCFDWMEGRPLADLIRFDHFHEEHEASLREWLTGQQSRSMPM